MKDQQSIAGDFAGRAIASHLGRLLQRSRTQSIFIALLLVIVIGTADYFSGYQIYWSVFYLVAISFAVWRLGTLFALFIAFLSLTSWLVGDWAAGVVYPNRFVPIWNAFITLTSYLVVIWLLSRLKLSHAFLETRIRERTAALRFEIEAREQLEKEVAEVSERERLHIGHELHDTVCQHLTATSLSLQVLSGKLIANSLPQATDADRAAQMVEDAIDLTRNLAKGLFPLELEGEGLEGALLELCRSTADRSRIKCEFQSDLQALQLDSNTATHLYRIAQEAVVNAIKHGHVSQILILKSQQEDGRLQLSVVDDGIGLPNILPNRRGLGLRIMTSRAGMIGGSLSVENNTDGGTIVTCRLAPTKTENREPA